MSSHRVKPRVVAITPAPESLTPRAAALSVRFDRRMDTRRGRVRLVWGRISAHFVNSARRAWRWSLRDAALGWSRDGLTLTLTLPPDCRPDGFRVRVEWSDLADTHGRLTDTETPGTVSYVLAVQRAGPVPPPTLSSLPAAGADTRADDVLQLYPSSPVGRITPELWSLTVDGAPQPFHLRTNRNPPDWIYVHPEAPLPLGEGLLTVDAHGLTGTDGSSMAEAFCLPFRVSRPPIVATPHPAWTEPPPGFRGLPRRSPSVALRFADRPVLAPQGLALVGPDGPLATPARITHDPTPGHYRSLVVDFDAELPPDTPVRLAWTSLHPGGAPGSLAYHTAPPDRPTAPLGNAASVFATPRGSFLQVHAGVHGPIRRVFVRGDGWTRDLTPAPTAFTTASGTTERAFRTPEDSPALPPLPVPTLRVFEVVLVHADGERALPGVAFDMGSRAVTALAVRRIEPGLLVSWSRSAPTDAIHLCALRPDGSPSWSGLFHAATTEAVIPAAWLTPDVTTVQLWLVRARPEDDLWDYFIDEVAVL